MSNIDLSNPYAIAEFIKNSKKRTPVKVYVSGLLENTDFGSIDYYGTGRFWVLIGENEEIANYINSNKDKIEKYHVEYDRRNSAIPL